MIGRACSVCDPSGSRPFPSDKELLTHVVSSHKRRLCGICIQVWLLTTHTSSLYTHLHWRKCLATHQILRLGSDHPLHDHKNGKNFSFWVLHLMLVHSFLQQETMYKAPSTGLLSKYSAKRICDRSCETSWVLVAFVAGASNLSAGAASVDAG